MKIFLITILLNCFLFSLEIQKPKVYKNNINIDNWYISEKLDGIRAIWDGKKLKTKNNNIIITPKNFTKNFPSFMLDGELWSKRGDFEFIQSTVLDKTPSNNWNKITYNIFEVPKEKGDFLQRLKKAKNWFEKNKNKNVKFIKQIECKNKNELTFYLEKIIQLKGEGVIIKNPNTTYFFNKNVFKVKKFYDMEGIVIGINMNKKKLKSLIIKLDNEVIFNLGGGFTNEQRKNPPKIGETVTFKYYGFTKNNKPKFASFLRVRKKE